MLRRITVTLIWVPDDAADDPLACREVLLAAVVNGNEVRIFMHPLDGEVYAARVRAAPAEQPGARPTSVPAAIA
jgi:hypothetical protein